MSDILEEGRKKRGRPLKDGVTKKARIEGRVTDDTLEKFNYICESRGLTKTETLEFLINTQYNIEKFLTEDD